VSLVSANYHLPVTVGGVQIDGAVTKGYRHRSSKGPWAQQAKGGEENPWGLDKDARLRLWPAGSPLMNPGTFAYSVKQRWFASATQFGIRPGDPATFKVRTFGTTDGRETWDFGDGSPKVTVQSDGNVDPHAKEGYARTVHRFEKAGHYVVGVERTNRRGFPAIGHVHVRGGGEDH
jgi:hypothetical protein